MKTYVLLAEGFEIAEATLPIDILKRARVEVETLSISDQLTVSASNGVKVVADRLLADTDLSDGDMLFLPGGMPGSMNLRDSEPVADVIRQFDAAGKWLAAVCAAPMVYGLMGLLRGEKATCYPGFEKDLLGAEPQKKTCVRSGHFITGCGAGAGFALGREMAAVLVGDDTADAVLRQMMFQVYE
ncbi:MAG: DJ-1/PfpI family protein [Bacteroidales bacterium]|nr:DJ-1/PfpI family protein [Candidatus Liminaster caballi]